MSELQKNKIENSFSYQQVNKINQQVDNSIQYLEELKNLHQSSTIVTKKDLTTEQKTLLISAIVIGTIIPTSLVVKWLFHKKKS